VIDLKDGKRLRATDELPEERRGRSSDADLLVFAVVSVSEERLKGFYADGTDGIQRTARVAAVRWPAKEPIGFYGVKASPPEVVPGFMRKDETPRGNLDAQLARSIRDRHWPKSLSDRPEEFLLGGWQTDPAVKTPFLIFNADGTFVFSQEARQTLGLPLLDAASTHRYKFVDKSTVELTLDTTAHGRLGRTGKISNLTSSGFSLRFEGGAAYTLQRGK
jgi:hypothetical protein